MNGTGPGSGETGGSQAARDRLFRWGCAGAALLALVLCGGFAALVWSVVTEDTRARTSLEGQVLPLAPGVEMAFVYVPAGEFLMGSDPVQDEFAGSEEMPQHRVWLAEYWIGKFEVTNNQYKVFVDSGGAPRPFYFEGNRVPQGLENLPVSSVTWSDAADFCAWATGLLKQQHPGLRMRLPTEAEWEKAARGTDGRIYPWGNQAPDPGLANMTLVNRGTLEVGTFPRGASPFGALDMAGNLKEWVEDFYDPGAYKSSPRNNPAGPASGIGRGLRGGSFNNGPVRLRSAARDSSCPGCTSVDVGFRVVVSP